MSAKVKADDIFNLEEADSDGSGYDSEEQQTTKKASSKKVTKTTATKKKNTAVFGLDHAGGSDDEDDYSSQDESEEEEENDKEDTSITASMDSRFKLTDDNNEDGEEEGASKRVRGAKKTKKVKPLTPEELEKFQAARDKTGIVYLSKIPPFMKPVKLRHLLGAFGELGRVYLAPEGKLFFQDHTELEQSFTQDADCAIYPKELTDFSYSWLIRPKGGSASQKVWRQQEAELYRRVGRVQGQVDCKAGGQVSERDHHWRQQEEFLP